MECCGLTLSIYFLQEGFKRRMKEKKKRMKVCSFFLNKLAGNNIEGFYNKMLTQLILNRELMLCTRSCYSVESS